MIKVRRDDAQVPSGCDVPAPLHGIYMSPDCLVCNKRLSEIEKQMVIEVWRGMLDHGITGQIANANVRRACRSLDFAAERLAGAI